MKKLQINILEKNDYGFTLKGSKALDLLMDQSTPPVDLLVREAVQNSSDAVLNTKNCSQIFFNLGDFSSGDLGDKLDFIGDNLISKYGRSAYHYLSIKDTNTCGLLGKPDDDIGPNNNLFKLVYSFLESGKENDAGGSWGIGKSVYYRFGIGMVFYYSRTFENNEYVEKLCGAIIENENLNDALLRDNKASLGIAFFGNNVPGRNGKERSIPIYDHDEIIEFLGIFGIQPFCKEETGTTIIIPFFNEEDCSAKFNNDEYKPWKNNFIYTLKISLQRWYFPKISNKELFERKRIPYIKIFVNDSILELNPFFKTLQDLYLQKIDGCEIEQIKTTQGFNNDLGYFAFKKFSKDELGVQILPENLPNPFVLLDIKNSEEEKNQAIIFYTRKPGMIITYDDTASFTNLSTEKDSYLIGMFVLNDDTYLKDCGNDTLGLYFKECESANHKKWIDISSSKKIKKITSLKIKPFRKIQNEIKKILNNRFAEQIPEESITVNSALQRKLGEILLPPEDFGKDKEPTIKRKKKGEQKDFLSNLKKTARTKTIFNGFTDGCPSYTFQVLLKPGDQFICRLIVNTSAKKYDFEEWDSMDFVLPCFIKSLNIPAFQIGKYTYQSNTTINFEEENHKTSVCKNNNYGQTIFKLSTKDTLFSKKTYEIKIQNLFNDEVRIAMDVKLKPVDETIGFTILRNLSSFNGGAK